MSIKPSLRLSIIVLINVFIFYVIFYWAKDNINVDLLLTSLRNIRLTPVILAFTIGCILLLVYAKRLSFIIAKSTQDSFKIVTISFGANNLLPFRLGDGIALIYAKKILNISMAKLLIGKVLEKYLDLCFVLLVGLFALTYNVFDSGLKDRIWSNVFLIGAVLLFISFAITLLSRKRWLIEKLTSIGPIGQLFSQFRELRNSVKLTKVLLFSMLIWAFTVIQVYLFFDVYFYDSNFGLSDAFVIVFITSISLGIPSAPGGLGLFEAAIVFYLSTFLKITVEDALVAAFILHLIMAVPQIILCILYTSFASLSKRIA